MDHISRPCRNTGCDSRSARASRRGLDLSWREAAATNRRVMGALVLPRYLGVLGWLGTAAMAAAEIACLVG